MYGLRVIIPLAEQYDYYHGGIATFLRWRNLAASSSKDYAPFYDLNSNVYNDFELYITRLLTHRSNITGVSMRRTVPLISALTMAADDGRGPCCHGV